MFAVSSSFHERGVKQKGNLQFLCFKRMRMNSHSFTMIIYVQRPIYFRLQPISVVINFDPEFDLGCNRSGSLSIYSCILGCNRL